MINGDRTGSPNRTSTAIFIVVDVRRRGRNASRATRSAATTGAQRRDARRVTSTRSARYGGRSRAVGARRDAARRPVNLAFRRSGAHARSRSTYVVGDVRRVTRSCVYVGSRTSFLGPTTHLGMFDLRRCAAPRCT